MVIHDALDIVKEIRRRPSYRAYLWNKLGAKLGVVPTYRDTLALSSPSGIDFSSSDAVAASRRIRDILFEKSPYDGFDCASYPRDMQGWGSDSPALVQVIELLRPKKVCEVGSWKGRSAINMARAAKNLDIPTEIVCVDTWLGSPEHWLKEEARDALRILHGQPKLYYTFLANVVRSGVADIITPFPNTSENAAEVFKSLGVKFDFIYIDAAHEYEPAKRDIQAYYDILEDDGLLMGDDYLSWDGVTKAADEFALERGIRLTGGRGKFLLPKGRKYADFSIVSAIADG